MTEAEVLEALRAAMEPGSGPEDAFTSEELAERSGAHRSMVRVTLRRLVREGRAECVKVRRLAMDGRRALVPAYRLKALA